MYKNLRTQAGLSLQELSSLTKIPVSNLQKIEDEKIKADISVLEKLANVYAEKIDTAYVAGLFDRKSTISLLKIQRVSKKFKAAHYNAGFCLAPGYICRVEFSSKHLILIEILKKVFGCGSFYKIQDGRYFRFQAWSDNAELVINKLYPYLQIKRRHAEILLAVRELQSQTRKLYMGKPGMEIKFEKFKEFKKQGFSLVQIAKKLKIGEATCTNWNKILKTNSPFNQSREKGIAKYLENNAKIEKLWEEIKVLGNH